MRSTFVVFSVLLLLVSMTILGLPGAPLKIAHAQSQTQLVIGETGTPSPTFFQGANSESFIGSTETEMPYLWAYRLGIDGQVHPSLANVPYQVPGTNSTQWIVNLVSSSMKWSDGVPINSSDLAFSYGIYTSVGPFANRSVVDTYGALRGTLENVTILNSTAVKLTTFAPDRLFPLLTFLYDIYPWHYYQQFTGNNTLQSTPIFGGPGDTAYIPANYTAGSRTFNLVANPLSPSWNGKTPTIQHITVQIFTDESSLVSSLLAGTVNVAAITPSDASVVSSHANFKVDQITSTVQMFIYTRSVGYPWNITAFRQALAYLTNRSEIDSKLYNGTLTQGNPTALLPSAIPTFWPGSQTPTYNFSTSTATSLLQAAGLTKNSAGNWQAPNGTVISIPILADNSDPNVVRAAQIIQAAMQSVGLQANVVAQSATQMTNAWSTANFDMMVWHNQYAPTPVRYLRNPLNYPGYVNSTFKALIQKYQTDTDPTQTLVDVKAALLYLANAAVVNTVVVLPNYMAYSTNGFAGFEPAMTQAPLTDTFWLPIFSENFLTSITPSSSSPSTTSTSSAGASSSSPPATSSSSSAVITSSTAASSSTSPATSISTLFLAPLAVVVVVIVAVMALSVRRRGQAPRNT